MESISKSRVQGVWDPAHSTQTGIIAHSTWVGIPSGCRHHSTRLSRAITPGCRRHYIWLPPLSTRMYHIRNSGRVTFHLLRMFHIRQTFPDGRRGHFNFHDQTYPDPPIALTRRISQQFCIVPRCSPEASPYVQPTFRYFSLDILRYFSLDI